MYFSTIILITLGSTAALKLPVTMSALNDVVRKITEDCRNATELSVEDLVILKKNELPTTKPAKCFLECLYNKGGILKGGHFSKAGFIIAMAPMTIGNLQKARKAREVANACEIAVVNSDDPCETAVRVYECTNKNGGGEIGYVLPENL